MANQVARKFDVGPTGIQRLLIAAQVLSLVALLLATQFLLNTTGGTLFVFASLSPVLVGVSILILIGVAILSFRQRHRLFNVQNYWPGEVVFRQGDIGDSVYFIRSGEVEVVREDGPELAVLAKLPAGHYFGEMALLSNEPRNATIRTTAETELAALGKHNFLTMLSILPSTEENILKTIQKRAMER